MLTHFKILCNSYYRRRGFLCREILIAHLRLEGVVFFFGDVAVVDQRHYAIIVISGVGIASGEDSE